MLYPLKLTPFTAKELSPTGWLRRQLEIQAEGLSGNLDKIWPDIRDSRWIGGTKEGWERVPYWLDGFIPLAWLLGDDDKKARATAYIDAILAGQQADGWICPCSLEERPNYDMWALFLICKVLVVYHDCTGDSRIEGAVYRALQNLNRHMEAHTIFDWAATRWYECLIPLFWLYERNPEEWMLDLAFKLYAQGVDYEKLFTHWRSATPHEPGRWSFLTHVVNMAMALKSKALISRLTGEDPDTFATHMLETLLRDHGMAVEQFSGDECLSGTSPLQGTELCSVAEAMYSYEWLLALTGSAHWGDRLEKAAFNALPATISPDMWTHQYDQMTNQVQCAPLGEGEVHFRTNNGEAHVFGLEPNFGCCTANFNQAWPKFALSTIMQSQTGFAITAIAPCKLQTQWKGAEVTVEIITGYPFEDGYQVKVTAARPVEFTLQLRIPSGAQAPLAGHKACGTGFVSISRTWQGETLLPVTFTFASRLVKRPSGMYCLWRGPLLYALPVREKWERVEYTKNGVERKFPWCDYKITPQSPWNYGFAGPDFIWDQGIVGDIPFSPDSPPVRIKATMAQIDWPFQKGKCAEQPASLTPASSPEPVFLIPYGCTNLRMTEMPMLEL